jgi:predicted permease
MPLLAKAKSFLRNTFSFARRAEDLNQEIQAHVEMLIEENIRAGMQPAVARREALMELGGAEQIKEQVRERQAGEWLRSIFVDCRYAVRQLLQSPGFTTVAILTLALGIGATTAIFTLVDAVLLRSLPVANPGQLYRVGKIPQCCVTLGFYRDQEYSLVSYELYEYLRDHTKDFEDLSAFAAGGTMFAVRRAHSTAPAETYFGQLVSGNYFSMFGLRAYAGRLLSPADDVVSAPPAAVMSYRAWKQVYGLDPSVIGGTFSINNKPFTIVGVAPPEFYGDRLSITPPDFYVALAMEPLTAGENSMLKMYSAGWLNIIGRIRSDAHVASTEAQMRVELQQWLHSHEAEMSAEERLGIAKQTLYLAPGGAGITMMRENYGDWLRILMLVAGFVLLIVCANVANLSLLRGMERRQQTALRVALGAPPLRLIRLALTESVLLSLSGGGLALFIAFLGTRWILSLAFETTTQVPISAAPSLGVLLFAFLASLLTGILFGIGPAWLTTRANPIEALRGAGRLTRDSGSLPRKTLVIFQAALSVALLSASALLLQTLRNLEHDKFGFESAGRVVVKIDPALAGYSAAQLPPLYRSIRDSVAALPGVTSAAFALYTPLSNNWSEPIFVEGKPQPGPDEDTTAAWTRVSPDFFEALGNPIVRGRAIGEQDSERSQHVAVINEAFARKFFAGQDPIGMHFGKTADSASDYEVIGVAKDARYADYDFTKPPGAFFFVPFSQYTQYAGANSASTELRSHYLRDILVRTAPGISLTSDQLRKAVATAAQDVPIQYVHTLEKQVEENFSQQKMIAQLTSLFGALALLLAALGIYGVSSYNVARRTKEIGVRMALGADRASVARLVLAGAFRQVLAGLLLGIPLAFAVGRVLVSQLYKVQGWDSLAPVIAAGLLGLCAFFASLIPSQRAASLDPVKCLRAE